jgi:hypothetical protein
MGGVSRGKLEGEFSEQLKDLLGFENKLWEEGLFGEQSFKGSNFPKESGDGWGLSFGRASAFSGP